MVVITVTDSHPLKGRVVFNVNFISIESTFVWFGAGSWQAGGQKAAAHTLGCAGFPTLAYVQTPYRGCVVVMALGHGLSRAPSYLPQPPSRTACYQLIMNTNTKCNTSGKVHILQKCQQSCF